MTAGSVVLYGCAPQRVAVPVTAPDTHIAVRPGRPGFVVAAPHGTTDSTTAAIAAEIARQTGFSLVVPGRAASEHRPSEAARQMSEAYERRVLDVAQGPLRLYVEIHGDDRRQYAGNVEIATVGVDRELALRLRALAELVRDAHLRANAGVERLAVLVEPADEVTYRASGAQRDGILRLPERALHIELPRCARRDWRETYTHILADFLIQAAALPAGR